MSNAAGSDSLWPDSLVRYDKTLSNAADNLAFDEALLAICDTNPIAGYLRFWESPEYVVVLGRSNRIESEVEIAICDAERIPILRRASGGGTVLVGPGCLCYSLVLPLNDRLRSMGVSLVTAELMGRIATGLRVVLPDVAVHGISDLVWRDRKFSGNAQRWLRRSFIHHGTILYDFDLSRLARCLNHPTREPVYRGFRSHHEFVTNIPLTSDAMRNVISLAWNVTIMECPAAILDKTNEIAESRYNSSEWRR